MIRHSPFRVGIAVAATAVALSGCATFTDTDVVAESGDGSITNDEFESLAEEYFAIPRCSAPPRSTADAPTANRPGSCSV